MRALIRLVAVVVLPSLLACPRGAPSIGYGTAMADVGRRFEALGRAAAAGRFELAEYELGELEEAFAETLPHASLPHEGHPEVLPELMTDFTTTHFAPLKTSVKQRDRTQFDAAFEGAAKACNACHQASGHGFIEVPTVPGRSVPNLDPLPAAPP